MMHQSFSTLNLPIPDADAHFIVFVREIRAPFWLKQESTGPNSFLRVHDSVLKCSSDGGDPKKNKNPRSEVLPL